MSTVEVDLARHQAEQDRADRYTDALWSWITSDRVKEVLGDMVKDGRLSADELLSLACYGIAELAPSGMTGTAAAYDESIGTLTSRVSGVVMAELQLDFDRWCDECRAEARAEALAEARDAA